MATRIRKSLAHRSVALPQLSLAVFVSGVVYFDFWNGSVPPSPDSATLFASLGAGIAVGGALGYVNSAPGDTLAGFHGLLAVLVVLTIGVVLFPDGLPVAGEIGLLALVWTSVAVRTLLTVRRGAA
jgi:hypothetical protein